MGVTTQCIEVTSMYRKQSPLNEFMIILVFYEITKTNLTLALGTYKAKNNNDHRKRCFSCFLECACGCDYKWDESEEKALAWEKRSKLSTVIMLLVVILKAFLLFSLLSRDTTFSKQTVGTFYKLYLLQKHSGNFLSRRVPLCSIGWIIVNTELGKRGCAYPWCTAAN